MAKKRILIIEDDRDINELIRYNLEREGFEVISLYEGGEAFDVVSTRKPDLVLLDLMLPECDGLEICRQIKEDSLIKKTPIIMITAKGTEADIVIGLSLGADDYLPKPFSPAVLLARIKSVFRRAEQNQDSENSKEMRQWDQLILDIPKHKVVFKNKAINLTSIEFDILEFLSRSPGRVFSRDQILDGVWHEGKSIVDRAVDVHIRGLRKKLGAADEYVETVRGVGYRFKDCE